jgi:hypothetical protein
MTGAWVTRAPVGHRRREPKGNGDSVFITSDDPAIDAIIAAVRARDLDALIELTRAREWPCVARPPLTRAPVPYEFGPSCQEGEAAGTPFEGIGVVSCSGSVFPPELVHEHYASLLDRRPQLYAAFGGTEVLSDVWPDYDAVVVFAYRHPDRELDVPWSLVVDEGAVVGVNQHCGDSPKQVLDGYRGRRYLVAPPYWRLGGEPIEAPPDRRSGEPTIDAIIDAVLDGAPLEPFLRFEAVPCAAVAREIGGPPQCPDGVADETPIEVVQTLQCHGGWLTRDLAAELVLPPDAELWAVALGRRFDADNDEVATAVFAYPPPENARRPTGERWGFALIVAGEMIEAIDFGCASRPDRLVPSPSGVNTFLDLDFVIIPADERQ